MIRSVSLSLHDQHYVSHASSVLTDYYVQNRGGEGDGIDIPIGIGEGSHIRKAIVDKNARIGKNVMVCFQE